MHDTDMAGILYFPRQFRFVHDALEDFSDLSGMPFAHIFHREHFLFVVVHAEANYFLPLHVGDKLEVHLTISAVGNSSFTVSYKIYNQHKLLTGNAKTIHVTIDAKTRKKIPIPHKFKSFLEGYLEPTS
jgi:1,4-dihydroxy-2-naphthoyl-CoA hydrolase